MNEQKKITREREIGSLNAALNYHKKNIPEFEYAEIEVNETIDNKHPYFLIFKSQNGKFLYNGSGYNYMEMNAFIHGYFLSKQNEKILNNPN